MMTDRIGLHSVLFPLQNHNEKRKEVLITSRFVSGVFRTNVPTFKAGCRKKVTYKLKRRLFNQLKAQVMKEAISVHKTLAGQEVFFSQFALKENSNSFVASVFFYMADVSSPFGYSE